MDLLQVANDINAELGYILKYRPDMLSEHERVGFFHAVVTLLVDDLLDGVMLQLIGAHEPFPTLIEWNYDLRDKRYPRREGPPIREILDNLNRVPANGAQLQVGPRYSKSFLEMNRALQVQVLRGTVWSHESAEPLPVPVDVPDAKSSNGNPAGNSALDRSDLTAVRAELLRLQDELGVLRYARIDKMDATLIWCLRAGHIVGIHLDLLRTGSGHVLARWHWKLDREDSMRRDPKEMDWQKLAKAAKGLEGRLRLKVTPILTSSFLKRSDKEREVIDAQAQWDYVFADAM